eukprot:m.233957 g.233957  ORF g.233957 m.233957 type:complete len:175 (+) comp12592_c0_seq1:291-815(+)
MVKLWFMDAAQSDPRLPHRLSDANESTEILGPIGVAYRHVPVAGHEAVLEAFMAERGYKAQDVVTISPAMPEFDKKLEIFFTEHLHEDEEVRFIVAGSGFFDVRDLQDRWLRIAVEPGDLLVLPAGIYHRFTVDENNLVQAKRLFAEVPKWTPLNRPADNEPIRQQYLKAVGAA